MAAFILLSAANPFLCQSIRDFSAAQSERSVQLRFVISAGAGCSGYAVQHSLDSLNFVDIVLNTQPCGLTGSDEIHTEQHDQPTFNQMNYYRIKLSTGETSELRKVFVSADGRMPLYIFPNPLEDATASLHIRIPNGVNLRVQGYLYTQSGEPLQFIDAVAQRDEIPLNTSSLPEGLYLLWLTDGHQLYYGKFVIGR